MKRTFLFLLLTASAVAGPYPGSGPYPLGQGVFPGAPGSFSINPAAPGIGQAQWLNSANGVIGSSGLTIAPAGSQGVLNQVWFMPAVGGDTHGILTNMDKINLRIYEDSTNTLAIRRLVDLPIGLLFGSMDRQLATNQVYYKVRDSAYLFSSEQSTNILESSPLQTMLLKLPCYFTNGIYVELWNTYSNNAWPYGYLAANFSTNFLSSPFSGYRLQSAYFDNYVTNYAGTLIIQLPQSNGVVVGQMQSIINLTNNNDAGNSFEINAGARYVTAPGYTNAWVGGDDSFLSTINGVAVGEFIGWSAGAMHSWQLNSLNQYAFEGYRWFINDAFSWNNGLSVYKTRGSVNGPVDRDDYGIFYYAPVRASLVAPGFVRNYTNTATSGTISATVDVRGGNYLLVGVGVKAGLIRTITSITCNGVAMTNIYTTNYINGTGLGALYGLANPGSGAVVVTISGTYTIATLNAMVFRDVGGNGASTAIQAGSVNTIGGGLTTLATDTVVDLIVYSSATQTASVTGTGEAIKSFSWRPGFGDSAMSVMPGVAGTTTPNWNFTASDNVSWLAVVLNGD